MLLTPLTGLASVVARLAFKLVVVAVVAIAKINQFLTTLPVVTFVLLELSRQSKVIFVNLFRFFECFAVTLLGQTLLFVVGSF
jgi:hypothetical protein